MLVGCQTPAGYFIMDSPLQVADIRIAANVVIGKPRLVSANGRELYSEFHDQGFQPLEELTKSADRYYTKVLILGPRRPYEVQTIVFKETWDADYSRFEGQGADEDLSLKRARAIKKVLNISLEKERGFDVSKPF